MNGVAGTLRRRTRGPAAMLGAAALCVALIGFTLLMARSMPQPTVLSSALGFGFVAVAGWMFLSERYALSLAVLLLYLGLLDGFLKLKTGSQFATLGRDILLYSIVFG